MAISLIVGLGNPGKNYQGSRHNMGFAVVDALAEQMGAKWTLQPKFHSLVARGSLLGKIVLLVKPQTFMNESGRALEAICRFYKLATDTVAVVYDDVTIELARVKLSVEGGAGGHNGIKSLLSHIGAGFVRFRIGVGGKSHPQMDLSDHVLGKFTEEQSGELTRCLPEFLDGLKLLVDKGAEPAMNLINQNRP